MQIRISQNYIQGSYDGKSWTNLLSIDDIKDSIGDDLKGETGLQGVSVVGISKTSTNGNIDIYTVYFSDDTSTTFDITNGLDGNNGTNGSTWITSQKTIRQTIFGLSYSFLKTTSVLL